MATSRARPPHLVLTALPLLALASAGTAAAQPLLPSAPQIAVSLTGRSLEGPQVAVVPSGGFVAAWTVDDRSAPHSHAFVRARFFARNGTARSGEIDLFGPADRHLDDLAATADGGFWLVWEQPDRNGRTSVLARRHDRRGRPLTPAFAVHGSGGGDRFAGRVAATPDGGAVVAWAAFRQVGTADLTEVIDIVVRFFAPDGAPRGPELNVGPDDPDLSFPAGLGVAPDGSAWVLEEHSSLNVNAPGGLGTLELRHVAADGSAGPPFAVCEGSTLCTPAPSRFPFADQGALAMRPDGSFLVAWTYNQADLGNAAFQSVIQARLFGADGAPQADAFQVNAHLATEVAPLVAALPDGRFAVLWSDLTPTAALAGVHGRSFAADGTPTSEDFQLRDGIPGALAAGDGATVVAVFQRAPNRIVARRFASP